MLKTSMWVGLLAATMMVAGAVRSAPAQTSGGSRAGTNEGRAPSAYRLDFLVSELEDGKKLNSRQYSMDLKSPDSNEIKIGTRVPVEVKQGEIQYLDVGTNIWCRLTDQADNARLENNDVALNVKAEISNFSMPDESTSKRPAIRQMKIEASTIAAIGKALVMGSADDPNSKRQFQLEVTVTKLH